MIVGFYGRPTDLSILRSRFPVPKSGVTLRYIIEVAKHMRLHCRPLRVEPEGLPNLILPAIILWDVNRFVVLKAVTREAIEVHDPVFGIIRLPLDEASRHLTGVALEFTPALDFVPEKERTLQLLGGLDRVLTAGFPALGDLLAFATPPAAYPSYSAEDIFHAAWYLPSTAIEFAMSQSREST
jgi:ATP-binding cassette subfamily B protein RaxB